MPNCSQPSFVFFTLLIASCENSQPQNTAVNDSLYVLEVIDPDGPRAPWGKTTGDINGDGLIDIIVGGNKKRDLTVFEKIKRKLGLFKQDHNGGELIWYQNPDWQRHLITEEFKIRTDLEVADIDNDNDIDLFGTNWEIKNNQSAKYPVQLWRNTLSENTTWKHHIIDDSRPGQATFVYASDLDGDGAKDIITGGYWYQQPDKINGEWQRNKLGDNANNIALVADFDNDTDNDILASGW